MVRMRGSASQALAGQGVTPKRYEREREREREMGELKTDKLRDVDSKK